MIVRPNLGFYEGDQLAHVHIPDGKRPSLVIEPQEDEPLRRSGKRSSSASE
jgi:hypothetical protein